ncbi:MAG: CBS domain-containing protein, partial [Actinomycetota bacterium]|nr:CBS domain-containing protein [Actinomycetota bacterium]
VTIKTQKPNSSSMNSASSLRLCDIATAEVLTISPDTPIRETIRQFAESRVSSIVVTEHDRPVGIVTERDLLRMMCTGFDGQRPVRAIMSAPLVTVRHDMDFTAAQLMMSNRSIRHLVLVDDEGRLCGLASETDFRRSLGQDLFGAIENLSAVMNQGIEFAHPDQTLSEGLNVMASKRLDHIIVGDHRQAQGILTERDIPRLLARHVDPTTVTMRDVMSAPVSTIGLDVSVYEAAKKMEQRRVRHMVVVDAEGLLAGVVSQHRILDRLAAVLLEDSRYQMDDQLVSLQENSEARLHYLIENMPVPLCRVNAQGELVYINRQFQTVFGYTLTDVPTLDQWWTRAYPDPAYRAWVLRAWESALEQAPMAGGIVPAHEYMVTCHDGTRRTVEISGITLGEEFLATFRDVTEHRHQQSLLAFSNGMLAFSNGILQQVSTGTPLLDVLDHMARVFEKQMPGVMCSILLLTESGQQLVHAAGPSLPQAYSAAIDGVDIGPLVGSCGTSAYTRTDVFAADIATDPHWVNYKTVALDHGLAACWSSPILSTTQAVLGTFALYWPTPQTGIDAVARSYVSTATALAAIAIEGAQRQADLQANHAQLLRAEAYALLGSWSVDTQFQRLHWSAQMFRLFHMEPRPAPPRPDELLERIHPDDQYLLKAAYARMQEGLLPATHLMRTHPAFGPVRWIRPHSYPVMDEQGRVVGFEGTLQDVTEQVQAQERLQLAADVFKHAREAIAITDMAGSIVNVNDMFCHLTGYSADEVIGRNPRILNSGKQAPEFYEAMWRSLSNKGLWYGEMWNRRKNGEL